MAPELLINDYRYPTADVFSLGLTLYEVCIFLDNREAVSSGQSALPSGGDDWHLLRTGQVMLSQYISFRACSVYMAIPLYMYTSYHIESFSIHGVHIKIE